MVQTLGEIIRSHHIHESDPPVDLRSLYVDYVPVLTDLAPAGVAAFAVPPPTGRRFQGWPSLVFLDRAADRIDQRLSFAHEVAHLAAGHSGTEPIRRLNYWWHNHDEREAWEGAATLLIPQRAWFPDRTADEVAAICEVPRWLVDYYPREGLFLPR